MAQKIDLRFNDTKEAIKEIGNALKNTKLTDEAIAVLIVNMGNGINKTQVRAVLERARKLEKTYVKENV